MDATHSFNMIHNVELPGGRDKLLKLAEVDGSPSSAGGSSPGKARSKAKSSRGFFNGFTSSGKTKGTPTSSTNSLDLSYTNNIEHLVRKDSGKGSSISSKTSDICDHSETETARTTSSNASELLDLDLAGLRLGGETPSRIPQAIDRKSSRKASLRETKQNNNNNTRTRCSSTNEDNVAAAYFGDGNTSHQQTRHRHSAQSNIPVFKPNKSTTSDGSSTTTTRLQPTVPINRLFRTPNSFVRSPSMPSPNVFNDSSEAVLSQAANQMRHSQTRLPSSLGAGAGGDVPIDLFTQRRLDMLDRMAESRRAFLKSRAFDPTTDAFLRKFNNQFDRRFDDSFMLGGQLDFDPFLGAGQQNRFMMFDEEDMFLNTPRKIGNARSGMTPTTSSTTTKPFHLFSTPDQAQYETVMLKKTQKEVLDELRGGGKQDGAGDSMTKSASFDSIEWMGKAPTPEMITKTSSTNNRNSQASGNDLSGVGHLEDKTEEEEELGLINRFKKSYSHYFTRQTTCPNLKDNRKTSIVISKPTTTTLTKATITNINEDINKNKIVLQADSPKNITPIVVSPNKKHSLDLSPPLPAQTESNNNLPVGKFERHRSASNRFESVGARKSYRRQPNRKSFKMKRSFSQPMDDETIAKSVLMTTSKTSNSGTTPNSPTHHHRHHGDDDEDQEDDDEDEDFDDCHGESSDEVIYAEAIWDYFSNDPEELSFHAGDLIDVSDTSNKEWWWGTIKGTDGGEETTRYGWIPANYVRPRVNQEETIEEALDDQTSPPPTSSDGGGTDQANVSSDSLLNSPDKRMSMSRISAEQVRSNVVLEIINTERVFVKNLKDVIDGYLKPCRDRVDMFDEARIQTIFCNIEELYRFQQNFLAELEAAIKWKALASSEVGNVFLRNESGFAVYCEFCKNHPLAISELQDLYTEHRYVVFFEGCRLLQNMIDISLDGFLLTPIQKICKYPLQLGELLKYTRAGHADHEPLVAANAAMQRVAQLVNERKRRFEALEQLISLQETFENWDGDQLIDSCSLLVASGEVARFTSASSWSAKEVSLFLFDRFLVMAKKREKGGLLRKVDTYSFKSRIEAVDIEQVSAVDESVKDPTFNFAVKNGFKFYCRSKTKWYLFQAKTTKERDNWLRAFEEREARVAEDEAQGFVVTDQDRKGARMAHANRRKPRKPRLRRSRAAGGTKSKKPDTVIAEIPLPTLFGQDAGLAMSSFDRANRAGSLPSCIMQERMKAQQQAAGTLGHRLGSMSKKSRSNWFYLSGKSKKNRLKRNLK